MSSVISVAPCEIVSLKLKFDSFVKMRVAQGILERQELDEALDAAQRELEEDLARMER
jgi:hypothetical protein